MLVLGARGATGYVLGRGAGSAAFTPLSIAGCQCWFDASQLTGLNDGDAIATWTDASGNGRNLTQATATAKPTYRTTSVQFDGNSDYMQMSASLTSGTIFVVAQRTSGGIVGVLSTNGNYFFGYESSTSFYAGSSGVYKKSLVGGTWNIATILSSTGSGIVRINGTAGTTQTSGVWAMQWNRVGMYTANNLHFGGYIAEIIAYSGTLSATDYDAIERYLSVKYSIALA